MGYQGPGFVKLGISALLYKVSGARHFGAPRVKRFWIGGITEWGFELVKD